MNRVRRALGWVLAAVAWLVLVAYLLAPGRLTRWREAARCLVDSAHGRVCARWLTP